MPSHARALASSAARIEPARSAMGAPMRPGDATHARAADWRFKNSRPRFVVASA